MGEAYKKFETRVRLGDLAPELLAALKELVDDFGYVSPHGDDCECGEFEEKGDCCHLRARALIAKAST